MRFFDFLLDPFTTNIIMITVIIINKKRIYEVANELPNDLRLGLKNSDFREGSWKISELDRTIA